MSPSLLGTTLVSFSALNTTRFIKSLLFWLSIVLPVSNSSGSEPSKILVFGDSISAAYGIQRDDGWVELLRKKLTEQKLSWQVVNASVSGETTSGGIVRLPTILKEHNPKIIIIELGGNDALRGYPIDIIRDNVTNLVYLGKKFGCTVIIAGMRIPPNYGIKYTQAFENIFAEVARNTNTALLPFLLADISIGNGFVQNDGIHPTKKAQPILLKNIWPYVLNAIEEAT